MAKTFYISPAGVWLYPWVNKADTKFNAEGLFKVNNVLEGEAALKERAKIDKLVDEAFDEHTKDMTAGERKKWDKFYPYEVEEDADGNATGRIIFHYRQNAKIKRRDGSTVEVKIGIYDGNDNAMSKPVFGGSKGRVCYSARAIVIASTKKAGVRLDFNKVQVLQLASGSGGIGSTGGFGSVEGSYVDDGDEPETQAEGGAAPATSGDY